MTRTDAILQSVRELLQARKAELDRAGDLRSMTIDLKFSDDCLEPRTVIDRIERENVKRRK